MSNAKELKFTIPSGKATKQLKFKRIDESRRKLVISTNFLPLFDFHKGDKVVETSLGKGKGIRIDRVYDLFDAPMKTKQVYSRQYKTRKNNPIETLMEVSSQKLIRDSFPSWCTKVHVVMKKGVVFITPLTSHKERAIMNATPESRHEVFAACTSGVDLHGLEESGFTIHSVIEYRPHEKRDKDRDLTETGALTVLRNNRNGIKNIFNEDIMSIDTEQLIDAVKSSPVTTLIASPQCDDFTNLKTNAAKQSSIDDLSTSVDMALDFLRVIDAIKPPVVVFEQVAGWYKSEAYKLLCIRMRRWGYSENLTIANALDHGGLTGRTRGYAVFSCLDVPFIFENDKPRRKDSIWPEIEPFLPQCRNVSHSKSLQDGIDCGRLRTITPTSTKAPTILKSQSRMAKDSAVILVDDQLLWPSEDLQKHLMGIPQEFHVDAVSKDIGSEILGQSIDGSLHAMVTRSIKKHIDSYFNLGAELAA